MSHNQDLNLYIVPESIELQLDVGKNGSHVTLEVYVVGDVLDNTLLLVSVAMPPPEAVLEAREITVGFGELPQFEEGCQNFVAGPRFFLSFSDLMAEATSLSEPRGMFV